MSREHRSHSCYPCRYAGAGENSLARCLHPEAKAPGFQSQMLFTALVLGKAWDFPESFSPLGVDFGPAFERPGSRA